MRFAKSLRIAAIALFVAGLAACAGDPLGPDGHGDDKVKCVWIEGVLHCDDG